MEIELKAKSIEHGSVSLYDHSKAVVKLSDYVLNRMLLETKSENAVTIRRHVLMAAAFHDIGKCDGKIQNYLNSDNGNKEDVYKDFDANYTSFHNILSYAYLKHWILGDKKSNKPLLSGILYHHVVPLTLENIGMDRIVDKIIPYIDVYNKFYDGMSDYLREEYPELFNDNTLLDKRSKTDLDEDDLDGRLGDVKVYHKFQTNSLDEFNLQSKYFIIRFILIFADRMVSKNYRNINDIIANNISFLDGLWDEMIKREGSHFHIDVTKLSDKERLKNQTDLLDEIDASDCKHHIISANAGFGKTNVGLRWIEKRDKKTLWVVPRNVIVRSTYDSIVKELKRSGNDDIANTVGYLIAGKYTGNENADIIVTNIDNFLSYVDKNGISEKGVQLLSANIIFDEYHEFLSDEPLFAAFLSIMHTRSHLINSETLLLSATPLTFNNSFWGEDCVKTIIAQRYNGDMKVNIKGIKLGNDSNDINITDKDSFVIANTVGKAQKLYQEALIDNKILDHSRFTEKDRANIEEKINEYHNKESKVEMRNTVFGTNVIGVGLDISAKNVYDFVMTPENTIQRICGRGGRFNEAEYNGEINGYICIYNDEKECHLLIEKQYNKELRQKWINILLSYDGQAITKEFLYQLYERFCKDNYFEIERMWQKDFKESSEKLSEKKPYSTSSITDEKDEKKKKLSNKLGYRGIGTSIYIVAKVNNENELSDPIIYNKNYIKDNEWTSSIKKTRLNYFLKKIDKNKYQLEHFKQNYNKNAAETSFIQALDMATPMYLSNASYNAIMGLQITSNDVNIYDED